MPLGRRSHRKARTGCSSCKKRRIKCDEQKPTCRNCLQHKIKCGYHETLLFQAPRRPLGSQTSPPTASRAPSAASQGPLPLCEDLVNVRLMHHFTTSTCQTLTTNRGVQALWRCQVPELGFVHRYLLQMIFAVAALHISRKTPSETQYVLYAYQQYEASLRNSSLALTQISPDNCHALYAVSALAFIFEFGTLQHRKSLLYNENGLLADWIVHSRGVHTVIGSSWGHLGSGCLKQMFECEYTSAVPAAFEGSLRELASHTHLHLFPEEKRRIYSDAVDELIKWSKLLNFGFYGWLCHYADEYGELLARKDPYALVIFGYSAVLLKDAEPRYWIDGWAPRLLSEIYGLLNTSLRVYLKWPMEVLGLVNP
ncbi:hypothetical protein BJX99DRAFT_217445 [Aspergillus californicus]